MKGYIKLLLVCVSLLSGCHEVTEEQTIEANKNYQDAQLKVYEYAARFCGGETNILSSKIAPWDGTLKTVCIDGRSMNMNYRLFIKPVVIK